MCNKHNQTTIIECDYLHHYLYIINQVEGHKLSYSKYKVICQYFNIFIVRGVFLN